MIELTEYNINKAIVNKGMDMVMKNQHGFIYTNETVCIFNSMFIFQALFNSKCTMLDNALEKLYYIAKELFTCKHKNDDTYYYVTVVTSPENSSVRINGIDTKKRSLLAGSQVIVVASLEGYYDKTVVIENLHKDETVYITFTDDDKKPTDCNISVFPTPENALVKINGEETNRKQLPVGAICTVEVSKTGYITYTNTFTVEHDIELFPVLEFMMCTITVVTTPSYAECEINGVLTNSVEVPYGTILEIIVSKQGYQTKELIHNALEDATIEVDLTSDTPTTGVLTIVAKDSSTQEIINNPTVTIDGVSGAVQTVQFGQHTVVVSKTGYQSVTRTVTINTATKTEEILLTPEIQNITLTIEVRDSDTNELMDADVRVYNINDIRHIVTRVSEGIYSCTTEPGDYKIRVTKEGYNTYDSPYNTYTSSQTIVVSLTRIINVNVTVNVEDYDDGTPIENATVEMGNGDYAYSATGGTNGVYDVSLPAGNYNLSVAKTGYETYNLQSTNYEGGEVVNVRLKKVQVNTINFRITVKDGSDNTTLINNATVKAVDSNSVEHTLSNIGNGVYTATLDKGHYVINASCNGYNSNSIADADYQNDFSTTIYLTPETPTPSNITLTIDITDSDTNNPITDATVVINDGQINWPVDNQNDGTYKAVVPTGTYSIAVSKTGYQSNSVASQSYNSNTSIPIALTPETPTPPTPSNINLTVHVTDSSTGNVITDATVILNDGNTDYPATHQSNGNYIASVLPGTYSILVTKTGYNNGTVASTNYTNDDTINVALTPTPPPISNIVLTVNVKDYYDNNENITGATVKAIDGSNNEITITEVGNGVYRATIPAGAYSISVSKQFYNNSTVPSETYSADTTKTVYLVHEGVRVEVDDSSLPADSVTMNGVSQKFGYYEEAELITIVANKSGYNQIIWVVRVDANNLVLPLNFRVISVTPGSVIFKLSAYGRPNLTIAPHVVFKIDNTDDASQYADYTTTPGQHNVQAIDNQGGHVTENFDYNYDRNTDINFFLLDN